MSYIKIPKIVGFVMPTDGAGLTSSLSASKWLAFLSSIALESLALWQSERSQVKLCKSAITQELSEWFGVLYRAWDISMVRSLTCSISVEMTCSKGYEFLWDVIEDTD